MTVSQVDPDQYTRAGSITKDYFRDVYPAIEPTKLDLSQQGKVAIVTGAGKGIGRVQTLRNQKKKKKKKGKDAY
jgi:hypothetical protein